MLSAKVLFILVKYPLKILVENSVSAIQHIGNRKGFEVLSPIDQAYPFAYSFSFTLNTSCKMACVIKGGGCKCSKTNYNLKTNH